MTPDKLNSWISLAANLGVLAGIVFLSVEISQSNRIAERDGRSNLVSEEIALQRSFLDNAELAGLLVKLADKDAQLSPLEAIQANSYARILSYRAANLFISYDNNLLAGEALSRQITAITSNIERSPGIIPFLKTEIPARGNNLVHDMIWEEIDRIE